VRGARVISVQRLRSALACAVLLCSIVAAPCRADTAPPAPIPDTPAGRRFADLMRLAQVGDEAAIQEYVRSHFSAGMQRTSAGDPGIVPFLVEQASRFGGFEVAQALSETDDQLTMLVRPRLQPNRWLRYVLKVESAPPHRVEGLFLMPASPDEIPHDETALGADEAVEAFRQEVERVVAAGRFSGVVLLAKGDQVVLERAAGEADRNEHVPVRPDTVFGLASMNKMFTAVAIGHLVEQGRIRWSDTVGQHLQGWLPDDAAAKITIDQLLSHTSGLGDYLEHVADDPQIRNARSLSAYRELVRSSSIEGTPEDGLRYSNTGYVVLGAIIEAVSGMDYYEFVREEIFDRAGMAHTGSWCVDEVVEHRATGYIPPVEAEALNLGRGWRTNAMLRGARGTSAGGGWSTAADLFRFARALVEGRLVRSETLETMLQPRARFPAGGDYGYGFIVHTGGAQGRVFGHGGGFPGVNGELQIYGDGAWVLVVLSNVSGGAGELVGAWDGLSSRIR